MRSNFIASTTFEMCTGDFNFSPSNSTDLNRKQQLKSVKIEMSPCYISGGSDSGTEPVDSNSNYSSTLNDDDETIVKKPTLSDTKLKNIIKFGPIVVRPRRKPALTLSTGRRSKYEVLPPIEDHKRQIRRARNRAAAENVRIRRLTIEERLNKQIQDLEQESDSLISNINVLKNQKTHLQTLLTTHMYVCMISDQVDGSISLNENDCTSIFPLDNSTQKNDLQSLNYLPSSFDFNNYIRTISDISSISTTSTATTTSNYLSWDKPSLSQDSVFPDFDNTFYSQNNFDSCDDLDELLFSR
ncbi:unnamed protein product [Didymodactylos carnosus]|uniref:BZIP domain-containing protein n=1 Tax=Didymodactylos carnosus TaxID=1234261 RepID=A0A814PUT1_9BILA|nr:unnamed protein product [Didymodactylos carnosus]CAF1110688.1 unnamed protein product [Didymodactylos carnosus]CAF3831200.1 unnamed protein product [Didymodactylos carnosus]CAF3875113.1 unnamed protein product [Didymodactylos carnosus]